MFSKVFNPISEPLSVDINARFSLISYYLLMCFFALGNEINVYKFVVGKQEGDSPLATLRCIIKNIIEMDIK